MSKQENPGGAQTFIPGQVQNTLEDYIIQTGNVVANTLLQRGAFGASRMIKSDELVTLLNLDDKRTLKKLVADARRDNIPIISYSAGGYSLPDKNAERGRQEIEKCMSRLTKQAKGTFAAVRCFRRYLSGEDKQLRFNCEKAKE